MSRFTNTYTPRSIPQGFDHLVYLRLIEACNLYCRHCFIPNNPKRLKHKQISLIPSQIRKFSKPGDRILIQMHGGEPTLFGLKAMGELIQGLKVELSELELIFGIQTNLMNFNSEWAELYKLHFNSEVGISWDPVIRQTKREDLSSNDIYENRFWNNVRDLQSHSLRPYLVVTGTQIFFKQFSHPALFFKYLTDKSITHAHIERLTPTGYAKDNWAELGVDNLSFSRQMSRFSKAYWLWNKQQSEMGEPRLNLSPFDGLFGSVASLATDVPRGYGCWSGRCDTRFHTIDAYGYTPGCTALTAGRDKVTEPVVINFYKNLRVSRTNPCQKCEYRTICSSGCLGTEAFDSSGECSGAKHLFRTIFDLVMEKKSDQIPTE